MGGDHSNPTGVRVPGQPGARQRPGAASGPRRQCKARGLETPPRARPFRRCPLEPRQVLQANLGSRTPNPTSPLHPRPPPRTHPRSFFSKSLHRDVLAPPPEWDRRSRHPYPHHKPACSNHFPEFNAGPLRGGHLSAKSKGPAAAARPQSGGGGLDAAGVRVPGGRGGRKGAPRPAPSTNRSPAPAHDSAPRPRPRAQRGPGVRAPARRGEGVSGGADVVREAEATATSAVAAAAAPTKTVALARSLGVMAAAGGR